MNNKLLTLAFLLSGIFIFGSVTETKAQTVFIRSAVEFDEQNHEVSGMVATYVTYDIYYYYDPAAFGVLVYTNPTEQIDQDGGIGVNHYLYNYYPGYRATFTTGDYRPNKILCTLGEHGLQRVFTPTPFQWSDPYDFDSIVPQEYQADVDLDFSGQQFRQDNLSPEQYTVVAYSQVCIRTPTVQSVNFETINSPVRDDNPASHGGGQRIFPDRDNPGDDANKQIVRVKAQLAPSGGSPSYEPGIRVYFRNFDVDDPSDDAIIDANGSSGNDNRGMPQAGALQSSFATTDSNGVASMEFTTTMQPGDNFRVAVSTDQNYLSVIVVNGTGLRDSTGNQLPTGRAKQTELLSVWRRLHIEVDSMGPVAGNSVSGTIPVGFKIRRFETKTIDVESIPNIPLEVNRFENGRLVAIDSLDVISNTANTVTLRNNNFTTVTIANGAAFTLYDDDDFDNGDGTLVDGDDLENIPMPPTTLLTANNGNPATSSDDPTRNVLAPAYIWPVYDIGDNNDNVPFMSNVQEPTNESITGLFDFDQIATEESTGFWTVYLLGGYQYILARDEDPETETQVTLGVSDGTGIGSIVFLETNGIKECPEPILACNIPATSAHEIGHLVSAEHDDGGIMNDDYLSFSPTSIARIRGLSHP